MMKRTPVRRAVTSLALAFACTYASSAPLAVNEIHAHARQTISYTCASGNRFQVSYWNASNGQSFALVPVHGKSLLFVDTLAASGAKYQAGAYTWWTKGPHADLYDLTAGENAAPIIAGCVAQS